MNRTVFLLAMCVLIGLMMNAGCGTKPDTQSGKTNNKSTGAGSKKGAAELRPVADTYISCYPMGTRSVTAKNSEQGANAGASTRLKIKRHENFPLLKFDFSGVPAKATITQAELIVTMTDPAKLLNHVSVWTLHADWAEGKGTWDDAGKPDLSHSGACFIGPRGLDTRWCDYDDSDFSHVALGNGGNATCVTRARNLGGGKFAIDIDPAVVSAAIRDGQTLCLTDETGIWQKYSDGFFYSREAGKDKSPVLRLKWCERMDTAAPAFLEKIVAKPGPLAGSILVTLPKAGDDGTTGTANGYDLLVDGVPVPRYKIPRPTRYHRGTLLTGFEPGKTVTVTVTAFDEAGNTVTDTVTATTMPTFTKPLEAGLPTPNTPAVLNPKTNDQFDIRLVDGLTLFDPITGNVSEKQWRPVLEKEPSMSMRYLNAVRGEIIGFQILIQLKDNVKTLSDIRCAVSTFKSENGGEIDGATAELFREHYVPVVNKSKTASGKEVVKTIWAADILPKITPDDALAIPSQKNLTTQKQLGVYVDLLIPKNTPPGTYNGTVSVSTAVGELTLPLAIVVYDVTLPDAVTFDLEMNGYGHSADIKKFHATYRLCHKHRLNMNTLGYGHSRPGNGFTTPKLEGDGANMKVVDWSMYDKYYGPLFSGEVAKGLPRDGQPATHWYLPFHEGWPISLKDTDPSQACWTGRVAPNKDKTAYEKWRDNMAAIDPLVPKHFSKKWKAANAAVLKQFIEHFKEKGWTTTQFQFFDNHKYYFSSGSQSLWTMDEPQYGRDYRALNWILSFYRDHVKGTSINWVLRADISRPVWGGDRFDKALELSVGFNDTNAYFLKKKIIETGTAMWWYGGGRNADADPAMYTALFIKKWREGCSGGMPSWTAFSGSKSWDTTSPLRYINIDPKTGMPVASFRLKACRYGQQFIELLNILSAENGFNRWRVGDLVGEAFSVKMVTISKGPEDPGYSTYENLDAVSLMMLRDRVLATILKSDKTP